MADLELLKLQKTLDAFRSKRLNVLVSTSVLEEGIDVTQCNLVIRFDRIQEFRSYVQSKGTIAKFSLNNPKKKTHISFIDKKRQKNINSGEGIDTFWLIWYFCQSGSISFKSLHTFGDFFYLKPNYCKNNVLHHHIYIPKVQNGKRVLNRLVPYLKFMQLACWIPQASLDLYYYQASLLP